MLLVNLTENVKFKVQGGALCVLKSNQTCIGEFRLFLSSVPVARCRDRPSSAPRRPAGVALTSLALSIIVYSLDASAERVGAYKTKAMLCPPREDDTISLKIF